MISSASWRTRRDDDIATTGTARRVHARLHGGADHHRADRMAGSGARRVVARAETTAGAGRFMPARMAIVGFVWRPGAGRAGRHSEARERRVPAGMDSEQQAIACVAGAGADAESSWRSVELRSFIPRDVVPRPKARVWLWLFLEVG
jgi:hypothetical protein